MDLFPGNFPVLTKIGQKWAENDQNVTKWLNRYVSFATKYYCTRILQYFSNQYPFYKSNQNLTKFEKLVFTKGFFPVFPIFSRREIGDFTLFPAGNSKPGKCALCNSILNTPIQRLVVAIFAPTIMPMYDTTIFASIKVLFLLTSPLKLCNLKVFVS